MKLKLIAAAALVAFASPAIAKDVSVSFHDQEQQALVLMLDHATRNGGLGETQNTVYFYNKLQKAINEALAPPPPPKAEEKPKPRKRWSWRHFRNE